MSATRWGKYRIQLKSGPAITGNYLQKLVDRVIIATEKEDGSRTEMFEIPNESIEYIQFDEPKEASDG